MVLKGGLKSVKLNNKGIAITLGVRKNNLCKTYGWAIVDEIGVETLHFLKARFEYVISTFPSDIKFAISRGSKKF